jgi:hypothetical protein
MYGFDTEELERDENDLPIVPPITHLPDGFATLDPLQMAMVLAEHETATRRHYAIRNERLRLQMERRQRDEDARIPKMEVRVPIEPKWDKLPLLDLMDTSTVYPWTRAFETLVNKPSIAVEQRLAYFLQFPSSQPGTMESATPLLTMGEDSSYADVRNQFLREFGTPDPQTSLLAQMMTRLPAMKNSAQWVQVATCTRLELMLAAAATGDTYSELRVISSVIEAYEAPKRMRLYRALRSKQAQPRVFEVIMAMLPPNITQEVHVMEAPLLLAKAQNAPFQRKRPPTNSRPMQQRSAPKRQKTSQQLRPRPPQGPCGNCGRANCPRGAECIARDTTCNNCRKKGHFQAVCRSAPARNAPESNNEST